MEATGVFHKWLRANEAVLEHFRGRRVAVAYSGGQASTVCLYLLHGVSEQFGFTVEAILCPSPAHRYEDTESIEELASFWRDLGVPLRFAWAADDEGDLARSSAPCERCRSLRVEAILLTLEADRDDRAILATGHHLVDLLTRAVDQLVLESLDVSTPRGSASLLLPPLVPFGDRVRDWMLFAPMLSLTPSEIQRGCEAWALPTLDAVCRFRPSSKMNHLASYLESLGEGLAISDAFDFAARFLEAGPAAPAAAVGEALGAVAPYQCPISA